MAMETGPLRSYAELEGRRIKPGPGTGGKQCQLRRCPAAQLPPSPPDERQAGSDWLLSLRLFTRWMLPTGWGCAPACCPAAQTFSTSRAIVGRPRLLATIWTRYASWRRIAVCGNCSGAERGLISPENCLLDQGHDPLRPRPVAWWPPSSGRRVHAVHRRILDMGRHHPTDVGSTSRGRRRKWKWTWRWRLRGKWLGACLEETGGEIAGLRLQGTERRRSHTVAGRGGSRPHFRWPCDLQCAGRPFGQGRIPGPALHTAAAGPLHSLLLEGRLAAGLGPLPAVFRPPRRSGCALDPELYDASCSRSMAEAGRLRRRERASTPEKPWTEWSPGDRPNDPDWPKRFSADFYFQPRP